MRLLFLITLFLFPINTFADRNNEKYKSALSIAKRAIYKQSGLEALGIQGMKYGEKKAKHIANQNGVGFLVGPVSYMATTIYKQKLEFHYQEFTVELKPDRSSKVIFDIKF